MSVPDPAAPGPADTSPPPAAARHWWQIVRSAVKSIGSDQLPLLSAGVAFYAFLALFPALIALLMLYGLLTDPATVTSQVAQVSGSMPAGARDLIVSQLTQLASASSRSLGLGFVVALLLALWTASNGMSNLLTAINDAFDRPETRPMWRRRLTALVLTLGAIVVLSAILFVVAGSTRFGGLVGVTGAAQTALTVLAWVVVLALADVSLAVLYWIAPNRERPHFRWASLGATVALVLGIVASLGFSLYLAFFNSYSKTYGSLAGVAILLMWLWLTCFAVLLGAEIDAESERRERAADAGADVDLRDRHTPPGSRDATTARTGGGARSQH